MKVCLNLKQKGKRFKCKTDKCCKFNYDSFNAEVCNEYPEQCMIMDFEERNLRPILGGEQ